jgi:hypothetical protein
MKKAVKFAGLLLAALSISSILVNPWLGRIIPFPSISDECANLIHGLYGARNQEQAVDALAVVGYLIWTPFVILAGWISRRFRQRHRREP